MEKENIQPNSSNCDLNNNDTRKRRTEESFTNNKSLQSYAVTGSGLEKVEYDLDSFSEDARFFVKAVFDFVDNHCEQNNSTICEQAGKYFNYDECFSNPCCSRIGIYDDNVLSNLILAHTMGGEDKAVFDSILEKIRDKDEHIKRAVLVPIADAIESELSSRLSQLNKQSIEVEPIVKKIFKQVFQINKKDTYLFYLNAKEHNHQEFNKNFCEKRRKRFDSLNERLKDQNSCRDFLLYIFAGSIPFMIFLSIIAFIWKSLIII
ncbi:MAG: hypothetical protein C5B43_02825 [Verrucomicrobia bacterium]|nr:MAG: hypothetical protein C5B43_02825 [Verrucomicrobiota bacterium]